MTCAPEISARTARLLLLLLWGLASAFLLAVSWKFVVPLNFRDPDDALRLVQVRDLLAGQSWFDLTQHRIHPPGGTPMHWSRLVDLPLALSILALKPLVGVALAERITLVIVPLAAFALLCLVLYAMARRLQLGRGTALLAVAMLASSISILIQFAPVRIDHHATQILLGAVAVLALVRTDRFDGRSGLVAGLAMAGWLLVSIEGLPYAVAIGFVFGLRHMLRTDRWADLRAYMLTLTLGSALLLFATRAPADALTPWCDALSPSYLLPLAAVTAALMVGRSMMPGRNPLQRLLPLVIAGGAGIAAFLGDARQCLAGPFETLDPIVYRLWYLGVVEGLPITAQQPDMQALIVAPSLLGLTGSLLTLRRIRDDRTRGAWMSLLVIQVAALAVSLAVMRAMAFAHLVALPGNAALLASLIGAVQRLSSMPLRVGLTAATALMTPFGAASTAIATLDSHRNSEADTGGNVPDRFRCTTQATLRGLDALPPATLFTPLDIGAHMLVYTHHMVVATGHHRNIAGMKTVIEGLLATPQDAYPIVRGSGARYLVLCAGEGEVGRYRKLQPNSLIDDLLRGRHPDWLRPVPMRPGETVQVYRILSEDQAGTNRSATPFMQ